MTTILAVYLVIGSIYLALLELTTRAAENLIAESQRCGMSWTRILAGVFGGMVLTTVTWPLGVMGIVVALLRKPA